MLNTKIQYVPCFLITHVSYISSAFTCDYLGPLFPSRAVQMYKEACQYGMRARFKMKARRRVQAVNALPAEFHSPVTSSSSSYRYIPPLRTGATS